MLFSIKKYVDKIRSKPFFLPSKLWQKLFARLLAKVEKLSHRKWRNIFCGIISIAPDFFCKQPFNADYTSDNVSMGMFFHFDGKYDFESKITVI